MAELNETIENVRSLSRMFQSVIDLTAQLEGMRSVQQAVRTAEARLVKLQREITLAETKLAHAHEEKADAQSAAERIVHEAELKAAQVRDAAQAQASETQQRAQGQLEQAQREAQSLRDAAAQDVGDVEARRNLLLAEVQHLEGRLVDAKAALAKILGAAA